MHRSLRSLPKFVLFTALVHSANPVFLAVSESWHWRPPKPLKFPSLTITFSDKIELPRGAELQSTAGIACRVLSYYPGLYPNNSSFYFSKSTSPETSLLLLPLAIDHLLPPAVPWIPYAN
jgi:hypothetical protein